LIIDALIKLNKNQLNLIPITVIKDKKKVDRELDGSNTVTQHRPTSMPNLTHAWACKRRIIILVLMPGTLPYFSQF
jgi:hypothetical protein